jgi:hypothetical protein
MINQVPEAGYDDKCFNIFRVWNWFW